MMTTIAIAPLSVNKAYRGRRFATKELKSYKETLAYLLPKMAVPKGKLIVKYIFGVSSKASDLDNLLKAATDIIANAYGFNDREIFSIYAKKEIVSKGNEFIKFEFNKFIE